MSEEHNVTDNIPRELLRVNVDEIRGLIEQLCDEVVCLRCLADKYRFLYDVKHMKEEGA